MKAYLPSRKVLAAGLLAIVGTVYLTTSGDASLETLGAIWAPVAAAYSVTN